MPEETNNDYARKIVSADRLQSILAEYRPPGPYAKRVVQCHGCFDIVHPGHIRYLRFAKSQGDILVVSITGDALIDKEPQRPYIPQELRAENLAALELVDYVVIDPNPTARALLDIIRPDVYVKGQEYAISNDVGFLAEREVVEAHGGRVLFSSGEVVFSSSRLVGSLSRKPGACSGDIRHASGLAQQRLALVCRRYGIDRPTLSNILDSVSGRRVLILGDVAIERYVLCDANTIASESPMMCLKELDRKDYVGGAAVIAAQLASLGAEPILITALGRDDLSRWALETLDAAGVHVEATTHRPDLAVMTRFLVDDHKMFKLERSTVRPLDSVGEREASERLMHHVQRADAAIIHDGGHGVITPGLLRRLNAEFRRRVPFIAGGSIESPPVLAALRPVDLLCCSERRLRIAMNDFGSGLSTVAYRMLDATEARRMIVTLGKRGLVTFNRPSEDRDSSEWRGRLLSEHLPSFADRVVDRLGGGESLLTVATLSATAGGNFMTSAYLGAIAAAAQIADLGPVPAAAGDIRRRVQHRPELDFGSADASVVKERPNMARGAGLGMQQPETIES